MSAKVWYLLVLGGEILLSVVIWKRGMFLDWGFNVECLGDDKFACRAYL